MMWKPAHPKELECEQSPERSLPSAGRQQVEPVEHRLLGLSDLCLNPLPLSNLENSLSLSFPIYEMEFSNYILMKFF